MVEWFETHGPDILAIIGGLYTVALLIVKLTPTPADDKIVGDIAVWVRVLCKAFGLDSRQGVHTDDDPPGGRTTPLLIMLLAAGLLCGGCSAFDAVKQDPRAEYVAYAEMFTATVDALTDLRVRGVFDEDEVARIGILIKSGQGYLAEWQEAVIREEPRPRSGPLLLRVLADLAEYRQKGGSDGGS